MEHEFHQHQLEQGGALDLARALWRRKWLFPICFLLVVGPVLYYILWVKEPLFVAQARVLLDIKTRPAKVLGAPELGPAFNPATEMEIMKSEAVLGKATNVLDLAGLDHQWLRRLDLDTKRGSRVMTIAGHGPTPELARDLANALADGYVEHRRQLRLDETNETLAWLREQQADVKVKLLQAEEEFQRFKKINGIPSLENKRDADIQRYQTLSDAYLQAQKLRIEVETELRTLEKDQEPPAPEGQQAAAPSTPKAESPAPTAPASETTESAEGTPAPGAAAEDPLALTMNADGSMPPRLEELEAAILEKELEIKAQAGVLKERHPTMQKLQRELALLKAQRDAARTEIAGRRKEARKEQERRRRILLARRLESLRKEEQQAKRALEDWRNELLMVTDVAVEYRILDREAQRIRNSYEVIAEKIREVSFASASSDDTARVLDRAQLGQRVDPKHKRNIALAIFGGVALFAMVGMLLDRLDTAIRTPEDVEHYLGLPVVALIPTLPDKEKRRERLERRKRKQRLLAARSAAG